MTPSDNDVAIPPGTSANGPSQPESIPAPTARPGFAPPDAADEIFEISFRNAPIGIALVAPDGHWLNVNEALCRIVGYTREELLAGSFQDITHPDDLAADLELVNDVLAGNRPGYRMEKRYFHKDGRAIWAQLTATLVRTADGSPRCFISHVEEISGAVFARENLQKLSERLQLATEAAHMGVIDYDIALGLAQWDDRMFTIYGLEPAGDGVIDFDSWILRIHPADLEALLENLRPTIRTGAPLDITHRIFLPGGAERILHVKARVVRDDRGVPIRCIAVTLDVTEQHRASEELHAARDAAEAANRAKGAFLAIMSHEIRTPLHGIIGHSHLLAETSVSTEQSSHLSTIVSSGDALLAIIEDILDYSKIEAGKLRLESLPLSLRQSVEASLATLRPRAEAKGLVMQAHIAAEVPDRVIGDEIRLRQVLTNLLSNAVKFTTVGQVSLAITSEELSPENHRLHFRISDTGIGIPSDRIANLFKPFSQADDSITRRFGGTGLGLAICQRLVTSMGGTIDLESTPTAGTEINVTMPIRLAPHQNVIAAETENSAPPNRPARVGGIPAFSPAVAALRILVAEDNAVNRQLVQLLLKKSGSVHVEIVNDGLDAVGRLAAGGIDVVLMDCEMPRLDGYKATREIRRLEKENSGRPRVAIIALTAGAFAEHRQRALTSGMDGYLTKPLRLDALNEALARCLPGA